jgi:glycosyltransferase involved in cell wall biosynthesis
MHLSKRHDITVVSINDWWKSRQDDLNAYSSEFDEVFERIDYFYLTEKMISPIFQETFFRKRLKELLKEKDFDIHLNYNTLLSGYEASKRIKTVYDIADDLSSMIRESPQIPGFLRPLGGALGNLMMRKNIERAHKVTVTTEFLKETYAIPDKKCEIIPNGVDTNLFRDYGDTKEELGLDGFIIGYVGVLREWVALDPVFQALKDLDEEIKMLIVGKEGQFKENVDLAKRRGVDDRIFFTGTVQYFYVPKYISAMDICLIPFKANMISRNALPLKLFEYMACSKPVISSRIPSVKSVAGDRVMYASTREEYRENILKLYKDEELRFKMGKECRKLIVENYDWRRIVEKLEGVLSSVAKDYER